MAFDPEFMQTSSIAAHRQGSSYSSVRTVVRVLVASSDKSLAWDLKIFSREIHRYALALHWAGDFQQAQWQLFHNRFDLCIVDHAFDADRGIHFIQAVRSHGSTVPIIFISADGLYHLDEASITSGASDYLVRGQFHAGRLERCITATLERHRIHEKYSRRALIHETLTEISSDLIGAPTYLFDRTIFNGLKKICAATPFDSLWILRSAEPPRPSEELEIAHCSARLLPALKCLISPASAIADLFAHSEQHDAVVVQDFHLLAPDHPLRQLIPGEIIPQSAVITNLRSHQRQLGYLVCFFNRPSREELEESLSALPLAAQLLAHALERQREHIARKRAEDSFRTILEGTVSTTAENFFRSLVRHLATVLDTKFAFVAKLEQDGPAETMHTIAVWKGDAFMENEDYRLPGSPSESIMQHQLVEELEDVQRAYPDDTFLKREGIVSYLGTPLVDCNGRVLGVLSVMDTKPLANWTPARWILKIFAARVSAELERLAAEDESALLQRKLMQAQKMEAIGQLAAGIAHDLNNALFAVVGHLQLMKMETLPPEQQQHSIAHALSGCERASSLIGQLLCFSRQGRYNVEELSLPEVVTETLDFVGKVIGKEIEIIHRLPERRYVIHGDHAQLEQAITNLIINAKQAMPHGGRITISYAPRYIEKPHRYNLKAHKGDFIALSISDSGEGISEGNLDRIFEPFFTTKEVGSGTGLGLAMVYGIMQHHGGWVEASSSVGKGSTFVIYLPTIEDSKSEYKPMKTTTQVHGSGTVMVIDDEQVLVDLMRTFLERAGFRSHGFTSPRTALQWYRNHSEEVDLVILDMKMPEMNGEECFNSLRAANPEAGVVILSGFIQDDSAERLLHRGALHFFQKPIRYDEFMQWVSNTLRGQVLAHP